MNGNADYCTTFILALITISFTIYQAQGQGRTCSLLARPHPNGFCGEKLALAHRNLCFLIRRSYPQFFPIVKRSVPRTHGGHIDESASYLQEEDLTKFIDKERDVSPQVTKNTIIVPLLKTSIAPETFSKSEPGSAFIDLLQKLMPRSKRSLVCECCYGPCTVKIIARYC